MIFESNAASPLSPAGFSSRLGERCLFVSVLPATVQPNPSWAPLLLDLCLLLYFGMASRKIGRITEDRISRISKWIFLLNDAKCCVKLDNLFILFFCCLKHPGLVSDICYSWILSTFFYNKWKILSDRGEIKHEFKPNSKHYIPYEWK